MALRGRSFRLSCYPLVRGSKGSLQSFGKKLEEISARIVQGSERDETGNRFDAAEATAQETFTTQETPFWSPCGLYDFGMEIKLAVDTNANPAGTGFIGASFDTGGASRVILLYDKAYC